MLQIEWQNENTLHLQGKHKIKNKVEKPHWLLEAFSLNCDFEVIGNITKMFPSFIENSLESTTKLNVNILHLIFGCLWFCALFCGLLMHFVEHKLPTAIRQLFRYGKHDYKGVKVCLLSRLEVPKSWFSHFYLFATIWCCWSMYLVVRVSILHNNLPKCAKVYLDLMGGGKHNRKVLLDTTSAVIALTLMSLQCFRRYYETKFVQIFSRKNKINILHYFIAYLHYFSIILVFLANTEGFVEGSSPTAFRFSQISLIQYFFIVLFLFSWWHQHQSNLILANLRKANKTDKVATEKHFLPQGGFFELISSPHMFFEIMMYFSLLGFLAKNITWWLIFIWVSANQVVVASFTHLWYKEHFKNYPANRKIIIPYIL